MPDIVESSNLLAAVDVESPRWKRQRIARSDHATDSPSIADASSLQDTAGNDKRPGVFAPPRAPILNFTHTTCYLGSVLQSLLQTSTVDMFLRQHKAETTCATGCPWCLLRDCRDMIHDPSNQYNPAPWTTFFERLDRNKEVANRWRFGICQHDAMEALIAILHDAGNETMGFQQASFQRVQRMFGTRVRSVVWSSYPCGCISDKMCKSKEETYTHIQLALSADAAPCSLLDILERENSPDEVDPPSEYQACHHCGKPPASERTLHIVGASRLMVISLSRFKVVQTQMAGPQTSTFKAIKINVPVTPNPRIQLGGNHYLLKAIVVHRGENIQDGHYVCYGRRSDTTF